MAKPKTRKQVGALPVIVDKTDMLRVFLMTSLDTKRFIIPKGWPMRGRKDYRAAAIEAQQEAGLIGRIHRKSIGSYSYWKRRADRFEYCKVRVFVLEVARQLPAWREKGQRRGAWFGLDDAADLVDDAGLVPMIRDLPKAVRRRSKKARGS